MLMRYKVKKTTASYIRISSYFSLIYTRQPVLTKKGKQNKMHQFKIALQGAINRFCFNSSAADWVQRFVYFLKNRMAELILRTASADIVSVRLVF